ncbi:D-amino acid dehydrogenase [Sphingobium aquiterrae]|uniref:D-amino acid dehydrogenase n=1 Tax=Sphingobium aquiterrae TaxID=2038656 RepID=UPI0030176344
MKIAVLGSGVIGVTSAYYLAKAGHEVTVIDRQPGPALETSFANAGEISPGYASPWAGPGIPQKAIKWLLMNHPPLILRPAVDREMLGWLFAMLRNCTAQRYALNKERMVRIAEFSRDCLIDLRAQTGIDYDQRMQGTLQLFRTEKQVQDSAKDVAVLRETGVPYEVLDPAGCIAAEPALAVVKEKFVGGLRLPGDETGDCFKFTVALAALAQAQGVTFRHDTGIRRIDMAGGQVRAIQTDKGDVQADRYLVALGSYSAGLLRPLGLKLPVYPVKGYSITAPIVEPDRAPVSTLMDESYKIAITRLGDRIRVGGMAEISGYKLGLEQRRRDTLAFSVGDLFPGAGDLLGASFWSGLRPMTPDGTPVIGATSIPNLFLNTGHGTLGWTMSCGSAHVIADLMSDRQAAIDTSDLSLSRYA